MAILAIFFIGVTLTIAIVGTMLHRAAKEEKERQQETIQAKTAIYRKFAEDFAKVGWPAWGYVTHLPPEQRSRMEKGIYSKRMKLLNYDPEMHTACVLGEHGETYDIDVSGCSCPDFRKRGLPCKHMYFAVIEIELTQTIGNPSMIVALELGFGSKIDISMKQFLQIVPRRSSTHQWFSIHAAIIGLQLSLLIYSWQL